MCKKGSRLKRAKKTRMKLRQLSKMRLCVYRTPKHIYAQIISEDSSKILVAFSTLSKSLKKDNIYGGNIQASTMVGEAIAKLAAKQNITTVSFDRSGFKYHGRVKALADSARINGLNF